MNKATKERNDLRTKLTTMIRDGLVYRHDPATVGHEQHTAECWTVDDDPR